MAYVIAVVIAVMIKIGILMTNTKFITIRKCYGFEWEAYRDTRTNDYIAICHTFSKSVGSETWEDLWEEILKASKEKRKLERNTRGRRRRK